MNNEIMYATQKVILVGNGLAVCIPKLISTALEIQRSSLVEVTFRNTGKIAEPDTRQKSKVKDKIPKFIETDEPIEEEY